MSRLRSRRARLIATAIAIAVVAAAIAYWTGGGSGSGSTTLDNPQALTLEPGTPSTLVSPGASAAVATVATNPNPYQVQISSISLDTSRGTGGFAVDRGHTGCDVKELSFVTQDNGGARWTVPARVGATDGSLSIEMADALSMGAGAADACQGASFTVFLAAEVV